MNLSDEILSNDGRYQAAMRHSAHRGHALHVDSPQRSSWPIFWACFLFGVVALIAVEVFS